MAQAAPAAAEGPDAGPALAEDSLELSPELEEEMGHIPSQPRDASQLQQNELRRELMDRGIEPKGFQTDDARRLQQEFDNEFQELRDSLKQRKLEAQQRVAQRDMMKRKRQQMERELKEEEEAITTDARIEFWVYLAKTNKTPHSALLQVNDITARCISKALFLNVSLQALDLSRNALTDIPARQLADMLRRNRSLVKLELNDNDFGPEGTKLIADALTENSSLSYLSLEANPITADESDFTGVKAIGDMLTQNTTLTSLNLWRSGLSAEGGRILVRALNQCSTLIALDVGNNNIGLLEQTQLSTKLMENKRAYDLTERRRRRETQAKAAAEEAERKTIALQEKRRKDQEWIEAQRELRAARRAKEEEDEARAKVEAEARARDEVLRRQEAERKRQEEEEGKRGRRGKKGKKKK